jgi:hypothetical protein
MKMGTPLRHDEEAARQVPQRRNYRPGWWDPHATFYRLLHSQHVRDLRYVVYGAFGLLVVLPCIAIAIPQKYAGFWNFITHETYIGPELAVFGAVVAWVYQVGSARLGVVDLFACEISTLCRVATVIRATQNLIENFSQGPPLSDSHVPAPGHFTSQESYFPVFESNARDLQALDANVVINITAFYTYLKATRDSLRKLAETKPDLADLDLTANKAQAAGPWHKEARNAVYLLFLGLESARHAISDLVEFEPEKTERTIVILLSELDAYRFLRCQFQGAEDIFQKRIELRIPVFRKLVADLRTSIKADRASGEESAGVTSWEQAEVLWPALDESFESVERDLPDGGAKVARAGVGG